ncbi:MAG: hypothetical protein AAGA96_14130 [Verrucomicrobiota bacterium]
MKLIRSFLIVLLLVNSQVSLVRSEDSSPFDEALKNGEIANEGLRRCQAFVEGWKQHADPETGLIPRNLETRFWNARDAAADNYPFMVLTTWFTDKAQFEGRMKDILNTEIRLTSSLDRLPDTYDFTTRKLVNNPMAEIMFGSSEYVKDGLLPLTEWLGQSPWYDRMIGIVDDMWKHAPFETPLGKIVSEDIEVNGEMLQVLSRLYWMAGDDKYLEWATRLGDYYLLGNQHPTRDLEELRLRDHGCEVVSGLCELYATLHFVNSEKKLTYQPHIHEMLDRILEVGRNEHGLLYDVINPVEGTIIKQRLADTWGYNLNGFYTVYLIDGTERYREATLKALSNLHHYRNHKWEGNSHDGYADSIESALNLYQRERVEGVPDWLDSEIRVMWDMQQPDGIIGGWHGDGNFARTTIMYCLWKSQGVSAHPWREDLKLGAAYEDGVLLLSLKAEENWSGKLHFDSARHQTSMKLPLDWPRINQFPEWYSVDAETDYVIRDLSKKDDSSVSGTSLLRGLEISVQAGEVKKIRFQAL